MPTEPSTSAWTISGFDASGIRIVSFSEMQEDGAGLPDDLSVVLQDRNLVVWIEGEELGGHLVSGHVDGVATVAAREPEGGSVRFVFAVPNDLARFVAPKGSVALDGVSLTVNEVDGSRFGVNIIGHTSACTTFGSLGEGDKVNLEVDLLARYVARILGKD